MEATEIYGICIGGIIALLILTSFVGSLGRAIHKRARQYFLRHLYRPILPPWLSGYSTISRYEAIIFLLVVIANVCCVAIGVDDLVKLKKRLGHAALINLIPVSAGAHMNLVVSMSAIRYESHTRTHRWLGVVTVIEATSHAVLASLQTEIDLTRRSDVAGIIASSAFGALTLAAIPALRRRMFEIFSWLHTTLAIIAVVALWLHIGVADIVQTPQVYLLLACLTFSAVKIIRLLGMAYLNISRKGNSVATIQQNAAGVEVQVTLARDVDYHAGQFIYLNIPRFAIFQSHPFQIAWAYRDGNDHLVLVLLIQPRYGFTGKLLRADPAQEYQAFVEGPYGRSIAVGQYGTVLLFATGIGVAGQLPYVKELLERYHECRVKTRRIALFWEMDAEAHRYWVRSWMDELLASDVDYILDMQLFIRGRFLSKQASEGVISKLGRHDRITLSYGTMHPRSLIESEMTGRKGKTLVSLCTNARTTRSIVDAVQSLREYEIYIEELEFRPTKPFVRNKKTQA